MHVQSALTKPNSCRQESPKITTALVGATAARSCAAELPATQGR